MATRKRNRGLLLRIGLIAVLVAMVLGGGSLFLIQRAVAPARQAQEQLLTQVRDRDYKPERLEVSVNKAEADVFELSYTDSLEATVIHQGDRYVETDQGVVVKNDSDVASFLPYLDGKTLLASLLEADVADASSDQWGKLPKEAVVKEITYGETKAPSVYVLVENVQQDRAIFTQKHILARIGQAIPDGIEIYRWELVLNKRLGKVKVVRLTNKDQTYALEIRYK